PDAAAGGLADAALPRRRGRDGVRALPAHSPRRLRGHVCPAARLPLTRTVGLPRRRAGVPVPPGQPRLPGRAVGRRDRDVAGDQRPGGHPRAVGGAAGPRAVSRPGGGACWLTLLWGFSVARAR